MVLTASGSALPGRCDAGLGYVKDRGVSYGVAAGAGASRLARAHLQARRGVLSARCHVRHDFAAPVAC